MGYLIKPELHSHFGYDFAANHAVEWRQLAEKHKNCLDSLLIKMQPGRATRTQNPQAMLAACLELANRARKEFAQYGLQLHLLYRLCETLERMHEHPTYLPSDDQRLLLESILNASMKESLYLAAYRDGGTPEYTVVSKAFAELKQKLVGGHQLGPANAGVKRELEGAGSAGEAAQIDKRTVIANAALRRQQQNLEASSLGGIKREHSP